MILLGVNIDHVATIRQARETVYPDPVYAALLAEQAGADGITLHLREDRRHIQERDVSILKELLQTRMNLEMAVTPEMIELACRYQPQDCCLVPEKREELTTEGGLDIVNHFEDIELACHELKRADVKVSIFVDPEASQIRAAKQVGAPAIELHTGHYANTKGEEQLKELERIEQAAKFAHQLGLQVNAGHGLHYHNVKPIAAISYIKELNIGHAIIAKAIFTGLYQAVVEMKELIHSARKGVN